MLCNVVFNIIIVCYNVANICSVRSKRNGGEKEIRKTSKRMKYEAYQTIIYVYIYIYTHAYMK